MFFKDIKRQKNIKNTAELKTVADIVHFIYPILLEKTYINIFFWTYIPDIFPVFFSDWDWKK